MDRAALEKLAIEIAAPIVEEAMREVCEERRALVDRIDALEARAKSRDTPTIPAFTDRDAARDEVGRLALKRHGLPLDRMNVRELACDQPSTGSRGMVIFAAPPGADLGAMSTRNWCIAYYGELAPLEPAA